MVAAPNIVFAFECYPASEPSWRATVHARTAGQAKAEYWRNLTDAWPSTPFTEIRARKVGAPRSSPEFLDCARRRGVAFQCGTRVELIGEGGHTLARGVVVGHNGSANFDVLMDTDSPRYPNQRVPVHPAGLRVETDRC